MKKTTFVLLLVFCLVLTGCGNSNSNNNVTIDDSSEIANETPVADMDEEEEVQDIPEIGYDEDPLYADEHPADGTTRSYLTNMWVTNEVQAIRPLTVIFPTDKSAQPQYNIGQAGVLYEIMAEGGISRMMGVIQDWTDMERIGNIRSLRDYFAYIAKEWDPIVVHFGHIWYADDVITTIENIDGTKGDATDAFFRSADREAPHNAYANASGLIDYIDEFGYSLVHGNADYYQHFKFTPVSVQNTLSDYTESVDATYIDMSQAFTIDEPYFEYDDEEGLYYRFMYGSEHIDAVTGKQLSFKNIIIQNTYWEVRPDGKYLAFQVHDSTRDGWFFTNGKGIHITWEKTADTEATRYYDDNGAEIVLNTGKTMIFIMQEDKIFTFK